MVLRLQLFEYECGNCERVFVAPAVVVGDFLLMRSEGTGTLAVVPTVDNLTLDEVDRLVRDLPIVQGRSDYQIGGATQEVLSMVFDPDDDGSRFVVGGRPRCPNCGWSNPSEWRAIDPPEFVDTDLPEVDHRNWDRLELPEKRKRLADAMSDALSS